MRQLLLTMMATIGVALPAFADEPAPRPPVEVTADKDVRAATVKAVASALRKSGPGVVSVRLRAQPGGVFAAVRVEAETAHDDLVRLIDALHQPDVRKVTIEVLP